MGTGDQRISGMLTAHTHKILCAVRERYDASGRTDLLLILTDNGNSFEELVVLLADRTREIEGRYVSICRRGSALTMQARHGHRFGAWIYADGPGKGEQEDGAHVLVNREPGEASLVLLEMITTCGVAWLEEGHFAESQPCEACPYQLKCMEFERE
jgi:hypothetical protein